MIRNIVFDIGGVLADFRIKEFLMEKGFDGPMITAREFFIASMIPSQGVTFENLRSKTSGFD